MSFQLHLHGLSYELRVSADDGALHLDLEEHDGGQLWMGDFSAQYVEEITRKTGSFKKFALFVQMLEAALGDGGMPPALSPWGGSGRRGGSCGSSGSARVGHFREMASE